MVVRAAVADRTDAARDVVDVDVFVRGVVDAVRDVVPRDVADCDVVARDVVDTDGRDFTVGCVPCDVGARDVADCVVVVRDVVADCVPRTAASVPLMPKTSAAIKIINLFI